MPVTPSMSQFGFGITAKVVDKATIPLIRIGQVATTTKKKMLAMGGAAILKAGLAFETAFLGAMTKSVVAGAQFHGQMGQIMTLLPQFGREMEHSLREGVVETSIRYGKSLGDVSKSMFDVVSAGIPAAKSVKFMDVASKLAVGGSTDLANATKGLVTMMNAWQLQADDVSRVSDEMFAGMRFGVTTISELSSAVGRGAAISAAAGVKTYEYIAAIASLTRAGLTTTEAVTSVRSILKAVVDQQVTARKTADRLGIAFSVQALKAKGLAGFIEHVTKKTKGDSQALADLFNRIEALNGVTILGQTVWKDFNMILGKTEHSLGSTDKAFAIMNKRLVIQWARLKTGFGATFTAIGEKLLPMITPRVKALADSFAGLSEQITAGDDFGRAFQNTIQQGLAAAGDILSDFRVSPVGKAVSGAIADIVAAGMVEGLKGLGHGLGAIGRWGPGAAAGAIKRGVLSSNPEQFAGTMATVGLGTTAIGLKTGNVVLITTGVALTATSLVVNTPRVRVLADLMDTGIAAREAGQRKQIAIGRKWRTYELYGIREKLGRLKDLGVLEGVDYHHAMANMAKGKYAKAGGYLLKKDADLTLKEVKELAFWSKSDPNWRIYRRRGEQVWGERIWDEMAAERLAKEEKPEPSVRVLTHVNDWIVQDIVQRAHIAEESTNAGGNRYLDGERTSASPAWYGGM